MKAEGRIYLLRPQWKEIFKAYGGFRKWRVAKIVSLEKIGKVRMADWYRIATVSEIVARDGMASKSTKVK